VANTQSGIDWAAHARRYRDKVLALVETRGGFTGLRSHIVAERMLTPIDFEQGMNIYRGAIFGLSHTLDQLLYFRPHNTNEDLARLYVVGGNTHPGSGLPTIYQSARISAGEILRDAAWFVD
jgi:phytoene desaturase